MTAADHLSPQQFTTLFHGTSSSRVGDIRENGLYPQHSTPDPSSYPMLTDNAGYAASYMSRSDPAMLTYKVPDAEKDEYLSPPGRYEDTTFHGVKKPLPGKFIAHADGGSQLKGIGGR